MRVPGGSSDMTEAEVLYFKSNVLKSSQTERGKMSNKGPGKKKKSVFCLSQSSWDVEKEEKELCILCFKDI